MKVRMVREVVVAPAVHDCFGEAPRQSSKNVIASRWWAMVATSATYFQQEVFRRRAVRVERARCTMAEVCYYFGDHEDGALCKAWAALDEASELSSLQTVEHYRRFQAIDTRIPMDAALKAWMDTGPAGVVITNGGLTTVTNELLRDAGQAAETP